MALNPMTSPGHQMQTKTLAHEKIQVIPYAVLNHCESLPDGLNQRVCTNIGKLS
jgi:hypothetical protein